MSDSKFNVGDKVTSETCYSGHTEFEIVEKDYQDDGWFYRVSWIDEITHNPIEGYSWWSENCFN